MSQDDMRDTVVDDDGDKVGHELQDDDGDVGKVDDDEKDEVGSVKLRGLDSDSAGESGVQGQSAGAVETPLAFFCDDALPLPFAFVFAAACRRAFSLAAFALCRLTGLQGAGLGCA
eukprot:jgi/Chrzof1/2659/Cz11g24070.t1